MFNIKYDKYGEFYIINKQDILMIYDNIYNIVKNKSNIYDTLNNLNNYEYLYNYQLNEKYFDTNYKTLYEKFQFFNNNYIYKKIFNNNIQTLSILKYNPIDKNFTSHYELYYKFKKLIFNNKVLSLENIENNNNILEITNTNISIEALNFISNKYQIKNNYSIYILNKNTEIENRFEAIKIIINQRNIYNKIILLNELNNNDKYNIIINSCGSENIYYTSCYWIYASNIIKILYLLKSLLLLKQLKFI